MRVISGVLFLAWISGCASDADVAMEKAYFLLDQGNYTAAEVQGRAAVAAEPDNPKAKFVLATALIGVGFLGDGNTYLSKIADLLDAPAPAGGEFQIFAAIAPDEVDPDRLASLQEARDTLLSIESGVRTADVYLQLYVSRIFELAVSFARIGANSDDEVCNADNGIPDRDGIPDLLSPTTLDSDESDRFYDNLTNVDDDRRKSGLPEGFKLNDILNVIAARLVDRVTNANGDIAQGIRDFFIEQFGDPTSTAECTEEL